MRIKRTLAGHFLTNIASPFFHAVMAALALSNPSRWAAASSSARRLSLRRVRVLSFHAGLCLRFGADFLGMFTPLFRHSLSDAKKGDASFFCLIFTAGHLPDLLLSPADNISGNKQGEIEQPQAGCLCLAVPKHPRLNNLIGLAINSGHNADGIFKSLARYLGINKAHKKINRRLLSAVPAFLFKPLRSADGKVCAWRESNHHIPTIIKAIEDIALNVWTVCGSKVTTPSVMTLSNEGIPNTFEALAGNQDAHSSLSRYFSHAPGSPLSEKTCVVPSFPAHLRKPCAVSYSGVPSSAVIYRAACVGVINFLTRSFMSVSLSRMSQYYRTFCNVSRVNKELVYEF
jgi:hypothetical protein